MSLEAPPLPPVTAPPPPPAVEQDTGALSQWQLIRLNFARHKLAVASAYFLVLLYLIATLAEFFAPQGSMERHLDYAYCPPQLVQVSLRHGLYVNTMVAHIDPITFRRTYTQDPTRPVPLGFFVTGSAYRLWGLIPLQRHFFGIRRARLDPADWAKASSDSAITAPTMFLLGADKYGRDIFSRMVYGARVSLSVGLVGIAFTFVLGMTIGGVSGYVGGRLDNLIQRFIEIIQSFPHLPLWLALGAAVPPDWSPLQGYFAITLVLSLLGWTGLARVVRGKILALREEDYAVAARLLGASHSRILFRHLIPGFASHIIVVLTLAVPGMILGETSLSFLGLGLRPPVVSWGVMLQDCMDVKAVRYYPWLMAPVMFIITTVLCFNFMGDGLRDAADPYSSR